MDLPKKIVTAVRSVLTDGTVVETASNKKLPECSRNMPADSMLRIAAAGSHDVQVFLDCHKELVQQAIAATGAELMEIDEEFLPQLDEYTLQLCDWIFYRIGMLDDPPAPLSFAGKPIAVWFPRNSRRMWTI